MNLLIVGRKSKTQMRNMFYWAGIISILICLPLRVSAQSYEQMWKQVEVLEQKQLPNKNCERFTSMPNRKRMCLR